MGRIVASDYRSLKLAYVEVKTFIENEVGVDVNSLQTRIDKDLGCVGNDNYELYKKFVEKYDLDYTGFDYSKHFLSEAELSNFNPLLFLLATPFLIIFWLIKIITNRKINLFKVNLFPNWQQRSTLDLTFGDMLTWYLRKRYSLRSQVKFRLKETK